MSSTRSPVAAQTNLGNCPFSLLTSSPTQVSHPLSAVPMIFAIFWASFKSTAKTLRYHEKGSMSNHENDTLQRRRAGDARARRKPVPASGEFARPSSGKRNTAEKIHDRLTGKADEDIRPIAGSNLRLRAWGQSLRDILEGCRK
jgi:hypothetical protein